MLLIIFMVTAPIPTVDIRVDLPPPNPVPIRLEGLNPTVVGLRETPAGLQCSRRRRDRAAVALGAVDASPRDRQQSGAQTVEDIYAEARIFVRADQSTATATSSTS